jgi:hypothetical protein
MCVAAVAWNAHPDWLLVAIGNRDEYHDRPAAPLDRWGDSSGVIAGRDLRSGGTWLGVSQAGRFVLVTNRRGFGDPQPDRVSRGKLVTDMLTGSGDYGDPEHVRPGDFNPFNLLAVAGGALHFLSSHPEPTRTTPGQRLWRSRRRCSAGSATRANSRKTCSRRWPARPCPIVACIRTSLRKSRRKRAIPRPLSAIRSMARDAAPWWQSMPPGAAPCASDASMRAAGKPGRPRTNSAGRSEKFEGEEKR